MYDRRYEVHLIPFLIPDNFTIRGEADIWVEITAATTNITLHIYDVRIHEDRVTVTSEAGVEVAVAGHGYDDTRQFYVVHLGQELAGTGARLHLEWTGNLNTDLTGFYRSSYTDQLSGDTRWMAVTQFEATSARRALPCFDEPAMKAVFQVSRY